MIKNIIFDLAGVVLNLNLERDTAALVAAGLPDYVTCLQNPALKKVLEGFLNGLTSQEVFLRDIRPFCKPGVTEEEILWAMNAVLDDIPRARIERIIALKKRYKVYLLSNIYDTAWEHAVRQIEKSGYQVSDLFHETFLSYEMQLAKPDPRIFQEVIRATGLIPQETVYYDDTRENIEVGNSLGFHSVLVPMNRLEICLED